MHIHRTAHTMSLVRTHHTWNVHITLCIWNHMIFGLRSLTPSAVSRKWQEAMKNHKAQNCTICSICFWGFHIIQKCIDVQRHTQNRLAFSIDSTHRCRTAWASGSRLTTKARKRKQQFTLTTTPSVHEHYLVHKILLLPNIMFSVQCSYIYPYK